MSDQSEDPTSNANYTNIKGDEDHPERMEEGKTTTTITQKTHCQKKDTNEKKEKHEIDIPLGQMACIGACIGCTSLFYFIISLSGFITGFLSVAVFFLYTKIGCKPHTNSTRP